LKFITYQECRTLDGWQPVKVRSSDGKNWYLVLVNPWDTPNENICECKGYMFNGRCRHQQVATDSLCRWFDDGKKSEIQTPEQRLDKVCPRCGGPTQVVVEVEEDG
jgi:hypothetical protein